jgi:N-acetyl-anhydromuramoyl-L-alanine amidase
MTFPEVIRLSPNFSPAPAHERRGVLFHHSVMPFAATIARMADPASQVSYHALIAPDGTRCTLVEDAHIAWHAGASTFLGRTRCNDFLLGLSFAGDTYAAPLTDAQLASALEWLAPRWVRHGWTPADMTDHRSVAPGRKDDLNPVEWRRLHAAITARFGG